MILSKQQIKDIVEKAFADVVKKDDFELLDTLQDSRKAEFILEHTDISDRSDHSVISSGIRQQCRDM